MIKIWFQLTEKEALTLETAIYRRGREDLQHGTATGDGTITNRGSWLLRMGDMLKGQRRSQQKFDLEGG